MMEQLQAFVSIYIPKYMRGNWDIEKKRKSFNRNNRSKFRKAVGSDCAVCNSCNGTHRHHIIPLQRGGLNKTNNIISLCRSCHEDVHGFKFGADHGTC